ncbi:MAG: type II secretion system secretin GspD [Burkholderiaceae bacterium]|nr:type II secretion system secretin GspD [Burkholderiaceae bacterium]
MFAETNRPVPEPKEPVQSLKFQDAPVAEVVKLMLGDMLKVDYVVHPPLQGTITLDTRESMTADKALYLLEQALQAAGIVMARDVRGIYHVGAPDALRGIVSAPTIANGGPLPPGYGAIIIAPKYLGAGEVANILRPLVSPDAIVRVDSLRNILVMRGTRAEAEGWLDLVNTFDVNLLRGMSVAVFPLKYTSTSDAQDALRMLSAGTGTGTNTGGAAATPVRPSAGAPAARGARPAPAVQQPGARPGAPGTQGAQSDGGVGLLDAANPLFGALRVIPIERINALLVITPRAAYLDEVRYWIEQFDRPNLNSAEPQLYVYKVQNGSADHLAELLNGIYSGGVLTQQAGGPVATGVAPGLNGAAGTSFNVNSSFAGQYGAGRNQITPYQPSYGGFNSGGAFGSSFGSGFGGMGGGIGSSFGGMGGMGIGGMQSGGMQGPGVVTTMLGQTVRVMADRINNTLLIYATPAEYERIEATLKRLDIQRAQVLIDASIVEVTLGDGLEYGLQWAFNGRVGGGGRSGAGVVGIAGAGTTLAADGSTPSNALTWSLRNSAGNISAVLTALASKSLIRVISSPSLMVLDNHTAAIQVGDQVPVNAGTTYYGANGDLPTSNYQYKDTGVMLGVTPSVSAGNLVTLDINQIVTDINDSVTATAGGNPTFMQRQIQSQVAVRSGETLVLGGLIKDTASNTKSGVPFLSAIPILGALFGDQKSTANRTELLVILTPRVLRTDDDARAVSRELRERMRGITLDLSTDVPAAPAGQ